MTKILAGCAQGDWQESNGEKGETNNDVMCNNCHFTELIYIYGHDFACFTVGYIYFYDFNFVLCRFAYYYHYYRAIFVK